MTDRLVIGFDTSEVEKQLAACARRMKSRLAAAGKKGIEPIVAQSESEAPTRGASQKLRDSHTIQVKRKTQDMIEVRGGPGRSAWYQAMVHSGHAVKGPKKKQPKKKGTEKTSTGRGGSSRKGGLTFVPPDPFLLRAFVTKEEEARRNVRAEIAGALRR